MKNFKLMFVGLIGIFLSGCVVTVTESYHVPVYHPPQFYRHNYWAPVPPRVIIVSPPPVIFHGHGHGHRHW